MNCPACLDDEMPPPVSTPAEHLLVTLMKVKIFGLETLIARLCPGHSEMFHAVDLSRATAAAKRSRS
jgi:hypothetical protein